MAKKRYFIESELVFKEKPTNRKFQNLEGLKFGRLKVIGFAGIDSKRTIWICRCECEKIVKVWAGDLKNSTTKSCGCIFSESITKHGYLKGRKTTSTYNCWASMLQRCNNPKDPKYPDYGGRGIKACQRWQDSFENFLSDMGERPEGLTLERIENNNGYYKENCRWATRKEQSNNTRRNHHLTLNGVTMNTTQWGEKLGIDGRTIRARIKKGWSVERALQK